MSSQPNIYQTNRTHKTVISAGRIRTATLSIFRNLIPRGLKYKPAGDLATITLLIAIFGGKQSGPRDDLAAALNPIQSVKSNLVIENLLLCNIR